MDQKIKNQSFDWFFLFILKICLRIGCVVNDVHHGASEVQRILDVGNAALISTCATYADSSVANHSPEDALIYID